MIEIKTGTIDEQIIRILLKTYPLTLYDLEKNLHLSKPVILRVLKKLQNKGVIRLEPLPDKIYIRLLRRDFILIGKKRDSVKSPKKPPKNYEGMMYN